MESHGLTWAAIENFDPAHWYDILLDGPKKHRQMEDLKFMLRNIGKAGIPVMGYYFSLAGVWGWTSGPEGRGGAMSVVFDEAEIDPQMPIPNGMVWNMTYDEKAAAGHQPPVSRNEMWERLRWFLGEILPVAEECGVKMVAHPDDPPLPEHVRNVVGKVPRYREAFVDEGDIDMVRAMQILKKNNYEGVIIPDHTPEMSCGAPWHAGKAFALGYMRGILQTLERTQS